MAKRREKGDGSIYQRASDKKWVAYAHLENGKKRYVYDTTRSGVAKKLKALQKSIDAGTLIAAKPESVEAYLTFWLEHKKLKETTYATYKNQIQTAISFIGTIKLSKLTGDDIQKMYAQLGKRQAPGTIRGLHRTLQCAFNDAIKKKKLVNNPCQYLELPEETKEEAQVLTAEQSMALIAQAKNGNLEHIIVFFLTTAMRRGEVLGLRWTDIDFAEKTVKVQRALSYVPDRETGKYHYIETTPKSKASRRTIPLTDFTIDALKVHKVKQLEQRLQVGAKWIDKNLVFPGPAGTYFSIPTIEYQFKKLMKSCNLPQICIHELRHSAATMLLKLGVEMKVIQKILGHANYATTANLYAHVLLDMQQDAMQKMDTLFTPDEHHTM